MKLPDVNILVHAFREGMDDHEPCLRWLEHTMALPDGLAVPDHCLAGFLRVATNPKIFKDSAPPEAAWAFVERIRRAPTSTSIHATAATWAVLGSWIADDPMIKGNVVPDAYLAALATSHGCPLVTLDRGFARFPGLDVEVPAR